MFNPLKTNGKGIAEVTALELQMLNKVKNVE